MKCFINTVLVMGSLFASCAANAAPLGIVQVISGGSLCPAGSATLNPSNERFEVSIEPTPLEVGNNNLKKFDRGSCALALSVNVPAGYSVGLAPLKISGTKQIQSNTKAQIQTELFQAGTQNKKVTYLLKNDGKTEFAVSTPNSAISWSSCGKATLLRFQISASLSSSTLGEPSTLSINSITGVTKKDLGLVVRKCK